MGLRVNGNDLGMNMLPGLAFAYTDGQELPKDLYVYGAADRHGVHIYVDPDLPHANLLTQAITDKVGFNAVTNLTGNPAYRPAIGLARSVRESDIIPLAAKVVVMALYAVNGRVDFSPILTAPTNFIYEMGDLLYLKERRATTYEVTTTEPFTVKLVQGTNTTTATPSNFGPKRPREGSTARFLMPQRVYHPSSGMVVFNPTDLVYVHSINETRATIAPLNTYGVFYTADVNRLIQNTLRKA